MECSEVPIINPISRNLKLLKPQKEPSFGIILPFSHNLLLTFNNDVIYILDTQKMAVISTMSHFRRYLYAVSLITVLLVSLMSKKNTLNVHLLVTRHDFVCLSVANKLDGTYKVV